METYFRHEKRLLSILSLLWEKVWINNCVINCEINRQLPFCIFSFMTETSLTFFLIKVYNLQFWNFFLKMSLYLTNLSLYLAILRGKIQDINSSFPFFFFWVFPQNYEFLSHYYEGKTIVRHKLRFTLRFFFIPWEAQVYNLQFLPKTN